MSGWHEVNRVAFDRVHVSTETASGAGMTGERWSNAFWRSNAAVPTLRVFEDRSGGLKVMARCNQIGGREKPIDRPDFKHKLTNLEVDLVSVDFTERRVNSGLGGGREFGNAAASTQKLRRRERMQETIELTLKSLAVYAATCQGDAMEGGSIGLACVAVAAAAAQCLNTRASAMGGGSSEIQHTVLARSALGH